MMNKQMWVIGLVCVGLCGLAYGGSDLYRTSEFLKTAEPARTRETHLDTKVASRDKIKSWHYANRHSRACYKTLLFTTKSNQDVMWQSTFSTRSSLSSSRASATTIVPKDRRVDILYNPRNPQDFRYASAASLWVPSAVITSVGALLAALGLMLAMGVPLADRCAEVIGFTASLAGRGAKASNPFSQENIYADGHG